MFRSQGACQGRPPWFILALQRNYCRKALQIQGCNLRLTKRTPRLVAFFRAILLC